MDFLRQQFAIVQDRLGGLTASQKMLTAALAVIAVMTMLYWGKVAGTREMVPLLPTVLAGEELNNVTAALRGKGIAFTVDGGRVMVPADRQIEAFGDLSFNQLVPANTTNALDAMLDKMTPWNTQGEFNARLTSARQQYLGAILRTWPGVRSADVMITESTQGGFQRRDPRLAINIRTGGKGVDQRRLAASARAFAITCISGLKPENIGISIDGITSTPGDSTNAFTSLSGEALELIRQYEAAATEKLYKQFSQIPGVTVAVSVELDRKTTHERRHTPDPRSKIVEAQRSTRETQTPVGNSAVAAEPGVVANTAVDATVATVSAQPSGLSIEKVEEENYITHGKSDIEISTPAGDCKIVGATVGVPRSYFVAVWRQRQRNVTDPNAQPTDAELAAVIDGELTKVREQTIALTQVEDAKRISVNEFHDLEPIVGGPVLAAATPGAGGNLTMLAAGHAREIALGLLAVVSLFMVSRMVKKAEPQPLAVGIATGSGGAIALAGEHDDDLDEAGMSSGKRRKPTSIGGEAVAGEVGGESGAVMMGQELDPEILETSQMIEQVSGFVKQNPDAAAQMINRWMSRD